MNVRLLIAFFALSVPLSSHAEDPPTTEQLQRLVHTFVFSNLSTNFSTNNLEIGIRNFEVKGLWDELKIEVFDVGLLDNGQRFNGFEGIYHGGEITEIAPAWSGMLMSGLVSNGAFYYTYCRGSGINRTLIARLRIINGEPEIVESDAFLYRDLFVSADSDGKVRVLSGSPRDFNHWEKAEDFGFVGGTNSSGLEIVDAKGKVIDPVPTEPKVGPELRGRIEGFSAVLMVVICVVSIRTIVTRYRGNGLNCERVNP